MAIRVTTLFSVILSDIVHIIYNTKNSRFIEINVVSFYSDFTFDKEWYIILLTNQMVNERDRNDWQSEERLQNDR